MNRGPRYMERPKSEQLVDLHVYIVPADLWVDRLRCALNQVIEETVSAGFIRVLPETTIYDLRHDIEKQVETDVVPREYVFLKSVGRCLTRVKPKQEYEMKVKHFLPPHAYCPEIFLLEPIAGMPSIASSDEESIRNYSPRKPQYDRLGANYSQETKDSGIAEVYHNRDNLDRRKPKPKPTYDESRWEAEDDRDDEDSQSVDHEAELRQAEEEERRRREEEERRRREEEERRRREEEARRRAEEEGRLGEEERRRREEEERRRREEEERRRKEEEEERQREEEERRRREEEERMRRQLNGEEYERWQKEEMERRRREDEEKRRRREEEEERLRREMEDADRRRREEERRRREEEERRRREEEERRRREEEEEEERRRREEEERRRQEEEEAKTPPSIALNGVDKAEERQRLLEELERARKEREEVEAKREELVKKAKILQSKTTNRRNQARDIWKKKYFEEKKKTPPLEDRCNKLRMELESLHRKIVGHMEGLPVKEKLHIKNTDNKPSQKANLRIQATKLNHDIEELQRRVDNAKMKLTSEVKMRNQAETELRALRAELTQKKINVTLTRSQKLAALGSLTDTHVTPREPISQRS